MRLFRWVVVSVLAASVMTAGGATDDALVLASGGQSEYVIVISAKRPKQIVTAAHDLQKYLRRISGAKLEIIDDSQPMPARAILLGRSERLEALGIDLSTDDLGTSGYIVRTVSPHLVIAGARGLATRFGVYGFLREQLGCDWYAPGVDVAPERREIVLWQLDQTRIPAFEYREVAFEALKTDTDFGVRLGLNGRNQWQGGWGLWWHTLHQLVPPTKYFADHPEYFALVDGKRVSHQQICPTADGVFGIVVRELERQIRLHPRWTHFMVSQTDKRGVCEHADCKRINDREGTEIGATLDLVNRVAARFPEKTICTLAYWTTRKPPAHMRPRDNVLVMFCAGSGDRGHPFATHHPQMVADLEGWAGMTQTLFVWDYAVHFGQLMLPYPNLRALQPNMELYADNGAQGVFVEANPEVGGELHQLKAYLLARLLWDPRADADAIIDEFLAGYYGAASGAMRRYIDAMHDELAGSPKLSYHSAPKVYAKSYLSPANLRRYDAILDEAEAAVVGDAVLLARVREARMPVMYARLLLKVGTKAERRLIADEFFALTDELGITKLDQWNATVKAFRRSAY